jgi:hypothetical protein
MLQERRLRVSENTVLRNMRGRRENEVTRDWIKLRNEEIYAICYSPNMSVRRENEVTGDWRRLRNEEIYALCY